MARGRVIDREIYSHEILIGLDIKVRYLYHGLIIWADDEGRIKGQPTYLKAKIFPCDNITDSDILHMVNQLTTSGLINAYQVGDKPYLEHPKWNQWQTIRKDRFHPSDCPSPTEGKPLVYQRLTKCPPNLTKPNQTKPKTTISPNGENGVSVETEKKETDIQRLIRGWKMLTGIPTEGEDSSVWDKVHFPRASASAKRLISLFGFDEAVNCMEYIYLEMKKKNLSCTLETTVKCSDFYREKLAKRGA